MKKSRFKIFVTILASVFTLSGCLFTIFSGGDEQTTITPPSIDVVSSLELNLLGNNSKTLSPKLENSSLKNPVFEYASSNTAIATVSQDGVVTGVAVGKCNVTITLQSNRSITKTVEIEVISKTVSHYKYTLMFYMCGSDLEFYSNKTKDNEQWFFTRDIQEMLSVKNIPDEVKIIIETGGTKKWKMEKSYLEGATEISANSLQRWEVNNGTNKLKLIDTLNYNEMAKQSSFTDFLSWGLDNYEADQMGVIISGHGGGIAGCAYDDNYTDSLENPHTLRTFEVAGAAKTALQNSSKDKFTWIGYDCCVMQCADIATINSDYFEYMVASQDLEAASGWNHDVYLPELVKNPEVAPTEFLPKICDAFLKDNHSASEKEACYQALSVLDLSKADALVTSFESVASKLGSGSSAVNNARKAFSDSSNKSNKLGEAVYGLCDFNSLLNIIHNQHSIDVSAAVSAVKDLVYYSTSCPYYDFDLCGVNAFFPECISTHKDDFLQVGKEDYSNANSTKFVNWQKICLASGGFKF